VRVKHAGGVRAASKDRDVRMKLLTILGLIISIVSTLGINFIPFEMYFSGDFSGEESMLFYSAENILGIVVSTLFVLVLAPREELNKEFSLPKDQREQYPAFKLGGTRRKNQLLWQYLTFTVLFSAWTLLFLLVFIFLVFKRPIDLIEIRDTLIWISAFLALEVVGDWLLLRPMTLAASEGYLKHSMGRVVVLFLSVFIGSFLAFFANGYFVVPFIILKTLTDIAVVVENFRMPLQGRPG
jgi:hypothetical protein